MTGRAKDVRKTNFLPFVSFFSSRWHRSHKPPKWPCPLKPYLSAKRDPWPMAYQSNIHIKISMLTHINGENGNQCSISTSYGTRADNTIYLPWLHCHFRFYHYEPSLSHLKCFPCLRLSLFPKIQHFGPQFVFRGFNATIVCTPSGWGFEPLFLQSIFDWHPQKHQSQWI